MPVPTSRETLAIDLRSYGERDAAGRVGALSDSDVERISERADHYLSEDGYARPAGEDTAKTWALAMAAVEVIEGRSPSRLRWPRRKLKGIWPGR